jgi:hypothetical protein
MKGLQIIAILTVAAGIIGWVFTFSFNPNTSPFAYAWQLTLLANPIGAIISYFLMRKEVKYGQLLFVLNLILMFSLGPMWFFTDLFNMLTGK